MKSQHPRCLFSTESQRDTHLQCQSNSIVEIDYNCSHNIFIHVITYLYKILSKITPTYYKVSQLLYNHGFHTYHLGFEYHDLPRTIFIPLHLLVGYTLLLPPSHIYWIHLCTRFPLCQATRLCSSPVLPITTSFQRDRFERFCLRGHPLDFLSYRLPRTTFLCKFDSLCILYPIICFDILHTNAILSVSNTYPPELPPQHYSPSFTFSSTTEFQRSGPPCDQLDIALPPVEISLLKAVTIWSAQFFNDRGTSYLLRVTSTVAPDV